MLNLLRFFSNNNLNFFNFSAAIIAYPFKKGNKIYKGAIITNACDTLCQNIPHIKDYFFLVERRGWHGMNDAKSADVKLVDDLSTLDETKKRFPQSVVLEFSNADFVDTDIFKPLQVEKKYTGIQIAAWEDFKRHDLFVRAAALLPQEKFLKFGHFWCGGTKNEYALKWKTINLARKLKANVKFPYWWSLGDIGLPSSPYKINKIINKAYMGILTSTAEGVNRFKMECLSANIPFLIPEDACFSLKKHINQKTGVFFKPTPQGLAEAILYVKKNYDIFSPREYILENTGIQNATDALKKALQQLSLHDGCFRDFNEIRWDGRNQSFVWDWGKALKNIKKIVERLDNF